MNGVAREVYHAELSARDEDGLIVLSIKPSLLILVATSMMLALKHPGWQCDSEVARRIVRSMIEVFPKESITRYMLEQCWADVPPVKGEGESDADQSGEGGLPV